MRFLYYVTTDQGKRANNEDTYLEKQFGEYDLLGVFDGHGGIEAAQYIRLNLHISLLSNINVGLSATEALKQSFVNINEQIHTSDIQSGTTATVALIRGHSLYLAHVGDSRAVLIRNNKIIALTKDHKITDPDEMERYRFSKWYKEKNRLISQGKIKGFKLIAVSRSLGDAFFEDAISSIPDVKEIDLRESDILVIASDGLWNFVDNDQVLKIALSETTEKQISKELVIKALESKSTDNITVAVIKV